MIRVLILLQVLTCLTIQLALAQRPISDELRTIDSVKSGTSVYIKIREAILFTETYIIEKIGKDNFYKNYKFDSTTVANDILWTTNENGVYTKHSKSIVKYDSYNEPIEEYSDILRIVYHYNFAYRAPNGGFALYVQLAGDKSAINVQGLIELTEEKNLNNVLTREEVLAKIKKTKFSREVRKSIKKNITTNQISYDYDQFKDKPFEKVYYTIALRDIKEPAFYKFDPWTGELCCIVRAKFR